MKKIVTALVLLLTLVSLASLASAGSYELTVATDGQGITVYPAENSSRKAGVLFNGYEDLLSLEGVNGRHSCALTRDTTVWLYPERAMKLLPDLSEPGVWEVWKENAPCGLFLAEVTEDGARLWSGTGHKHVSAEHRKGTLVMVCGDFGKDYYVTGAGEGFMSKTALRKVQDLTYSQSRKSDYGLPGLETATVYTAEILPLSASATGVSDQLAGSVKDGDTVTVLRDLGDWVQVPGGFLEKRYLDPEADHRANTAVIRTDHPLNRLNVRHDPQKDGMAYFKLCAGVQVQVVSAAGGWTRIALSNEGWLHPEGYVKSEYVMTGRAAELVESGCVRVRLLRGYQENPFRPFYPEGTECTVIGVMTRHGTENAFLVRMDDGSLLILPDEDPEPMLEPVDPTAYPAKTTKKVTLRAGPNSEAAKLKTLKSGAAVDVLLRGEKWALVRSDGRTGYIPANTLKLKKR